MGLVTLKKVLTDAKAKGICVPAFDALDHSTVEAIIRTCEKLNKPCIIMVPEVGLPMIDAKEFFEYLNYRIAKTTVDIALELDHGNTLSVIELAINSGFSSVMFDGSKLENEENIRITKQVVEMAHAKGVSVEAEIGHVAGDEGDMVNGSEVDESMYTKPEDALHFVQETGVDALAVAVGTVHGVYKGIPKLDIERLAKIRAMLDIPLVLHGGSGVSDEEFIKAVKAGINKINIFTEISMAAAKQSTEYSLSKNKLLHYFEMSIVAGKTIEKLSEKFLKLFSLDI